MASTSIETYTSDKYLTENPDWHASDSAWKAGKILAMLKANGIDAKTIADIGCGVGGVIGAVAQGSPGARCYGYDVAPAAIARAQSKAAPGVVFHCEDAFAADRVFDLAMAVDVFEHVE